MQLFLKRFEFYRMVMLLLCCSLNSAAQDASTILVITNSESKILLDGMEKGASKGGAAFRIETTVGEHYIEAQTLIDGQTITKGEVVQLVAGQQKILRLDFKVSTIIQPILVADLNVEIPGSVEVLAWESAHAGEKYPYPSLYYAFEKGDEIILDVTMSNQRGTNAMVVTTYPANVVKYTNGSFVSLENVLIPVPERSIYRFTFGSNHALDRNGFIKIRRRPQSLDAVAFNPNVSLKTILTPVQIAEAQSFFVNGGGNATFLGGKSRIVIPVTLPANTIEWFYRFSASRNQADIDNVRQNFQLFGELSSLILKATGFGATVADGVSIAVDQLAMPPGADYCDIYLLDYENVARFEGKTDFQYFLDGSRKNITAGNVKVTSGISGTLYLGVKNPATYDGINVSVEVVALTAKQDYVMEEKVH